MSRKKLLSVLRLCPLSEYFGHRSSNLIVKALTRYEAQKHAIEMIKLKNQMEHKHIIMECSSS